MNKQKKTKTKTKTQPNKFLLQNGQKKRTHI